MLRNGYIELTRKRDKWRMRFNVQSITKVVDRNSHEPRISHFEVDLVDDQMDSDFQSSITLRVEPRDIGNYYLGQLFQLVTSPILEDRKSKSSAIYHARNFSYAETWDED